VAAEEPEGTPPPFRFHFAMWEGALRPAIRKANLAALEASTDSKRGGRRRHAIAVTTPDSATSRPATRKANLARGAAMEASTNKAGGLARSTGVPIRGTNFRFWRLAPRRS
jgi:hypothetical protein